MNRSVTCIVSIVLGLVMGAHGMNTDRFLGYHEIDEQEQQDIDLALSLSLEQLALDSARSRLLERQESQVATSSSSSSHIVSVPALFKKQMDGAIATITRLVREKKPLRAFVIATHEQDNGLETAGTMALRAASRSRVITFSGHNVWQDWDAVKRQLMNEVQAERVAREVLIFDARSSTAAVSAASWKKFYQDLKELEALGKTTCMIAVLLNAETTTDKLFPGSQSLVLFPSSVEGTFESYATGQDLVTYKLDDTQNPPAVTSADTGLQRALVREQINDKVKVLNHYVTRKEPLKNLVVCADTHHEGMEIISFIAAQTGFVVKPLPRATAGLKIDFRTIKEQLGTLLKRSTQIKEMFFLDLRSLTKVCSHHELRELCTSLSTLDQLYNYKRMVVLIVPASLTEGAISQIHFVADVARLGLDSEQPRVKSFSEHPARATLAAAPVVPPESQIECPICLNDGVTNMKTPCCKKDVCRKCWDESLESMARAGNGTAVERCPLCTVPLKKN